MAALDLLGRRWTLGVVWALRERALGFTRLQDELEGVSPSVLTIRLRELCEAGVVTTDDAGRYRLTGEGTRLFEALGPLNAWANGWARRTGQELDGRPIDPHP